MTKVRTFSIKSFAILFSMMIALLATGAAEADPKPKPKPKSETPTESVTFEFGQLMITYMVQGSTGPSVTLEGMLHLESRALLSDDGVPIGFTLHGNLSNASALSADGAASFVAVGASDGIPVECEPEACAPPFWTFTFRLIPQGAGLQPSLLFDLTVSTQYNEDGTLKNTCIVGQEGCDASEFVP